MNIYLKLKLAIALLEKPSIEDLNKNSLLHKLIVKELGENINPPELINVLLETLQAEVIGLTSNDILVNKPTNLWLEDNIDKTDTIDRCLNPLEIAGKLTHLLNSNHVLDVDISGLLLDCFLGDREAIERNLDSPNGSIYNQIDRLEATMLFIKQIKSHANAVKEMLAGTPIYSETEVEIAQEEAKLQEPIDESTAYALDASLDNDTAETDDLLVLNGLEDLLNNKSNTEAYHFLEGIALANGVHLVTGNEGPKFEAIKSMGRKALDVVKESFNSLLKSLGSKDNEELISKLKEKAETNKKLIQGVKDQNAPIKEASKEGLAKLSNDTDSTGDLAKITSNLKKAGDSYMVIDRLLGYLSSKTTNAGSNNQAVKETQAKIKDLERAISDAGKGNEENNDVVADNKAKVQENIKQAKESLTSLRKEEAKLKKIINGVSKVVTNITPAIFQVEDEKGDKDD